MPVATTRWSPTPTLPDALELTASLGDVVMGARHRELPAEGVQFHPESVLTPQGKHLLANFLEGGRHLGRIADQMSTTQSEAGDA